MENPTKLELIKTRELYLKEGVKSNEVVLVDEVGGDMYFTFTLVYVEGKNTNTHFYAKDNFHADVVIETAPNVTTEWEEPVHIGSYAKERKLYFDVVVEPRSAMGKHRVVLSFFISK